MALVTLPAYKVERFAGETINWIEHKQATQRILNWEKLLERLNSRCFNPFNRKTYTMDDIRNTYFSYLESGNTVELITEDRLLYNHLYLYQDELDTCRTLYKSVSKPDPDILVTLGDKEINAIVWNV